MLVDESLSLESPAAIKGASALLIEARERLGLSQKEVADQLHLSTSFIKHIDDGEFSRIPKPAFIKGYLRSYARVVGLSGDEIVALYDAELQVAEPTLEMQKVTEEDLGTASITGPVLQTGLIGLAGMALIVAVIWWAVSDPEEKTPPGIVQPAASQSATQDSLVVDSDLTLSPQDVTVLPSEQASPDQAGLEPQVEMSETLRALDAVQPPLAEIGSGNGEVSAILVVEESIQEAEADQSISDQSISDQSISGQSTSDQSISDQSISDQSISDQSISDQSISDQSISKIAVSALASSAEESTDVDVDTVKVERATDGTRSFITVNAGGPDKLALSFKDECWVEIADNQLGSIYYDLNQANDVLTIYGTAPFKVLLGKATGVEMIYNGGPVELEPFIGPDRAAKLTVPN
jgi:cytoskeleton protein RodZ